MTTPLKDTQMKGKPQKDEGEVKWTLIETAPVPYSPIGKGLAIVDIEMLQAVSEKHRKELSSQEERIRREIKEKAEEWKRPREDGEGYETVYFISKAVLTAIKK